MTDINYMNNMEGNTGDFCTAEGQMTDNVSDINPWNSIDANSEDKWTAEGLHNLK